ncbi:hypothetical protein [Bacillus sp. CH_442]|uniref:hypothetical protein n=1 Tax=Bacillus sp. CH_442 TaxID=2978217 RepID=UPI0030F5ECF6
MGKEIERKFICKKEVIEKLLYDNLEVQKDTIYQQYLCVGNEEVRIRKKESNGTEHYFFTIKKGKGVVREEFETEITKKTYQQLLGDKKPIIKNRMRLACNQKEVLIDIYQDFEFVIAEVEFMSEEQAEKYTPEFWMEKDITLDHNYKNQSLWLQLNEFHN